jgi:ATP-dependent helicase/nuclease subunit B
LNCAGTVVVSCAEREQDRELRPSPLFTELDRRENSAAGGSYWPGPSALEGMEDSAAPAVAAGSIPRGGTRILELQAKCPFRAFAEIRLGARSLEVSEAGLNARDRGSLLHIVLEHVWSAIGSQAELKAMSEESVRSVIRAGIEAAFRHKYHKGAFEDAFEREVRLIEASRLEALVLEWLALEKTRSPFTVDSQEQKQRVAIGPLQFDARIDRVDRLTTGREVIIDYKTGDVSTEQWEGERPDSPQVPLYAIAHARPIGAAAFARVQAGDCEFEGIAQEANALPDVERGDVATRLAEWKLVFEKLADEFVAGDARVDPKTYPATCEYCQLEALCRIAPAEVEAPE